jgi:hypothetical protein
MVGLPWDSKKIISQNIKFIEETKLDFVRWGCFYPFPGTEIRENAEKYGITEIQEKCNFLIGKEGPLPPNIKLKHITFDEHYKLICKMWQYIENRNKNGC